LEHLTKAGCHQVWCTLDAELLCLAVKNQRCMNDPKWGGRPPGTPPRGPPRGVIPFPRAANAASPPPPPPAAEPAPEPGAPEPGAVDWAIPAPPRPPARYPRLTNRTGELRFLDPNDPDDSRFVSGHPFAVLLQFEPGRVGSPPPQGRRPAFSPVPAITVPNAKEHAKDGASCGCRYGAGKEPSDDDAWWTPMQRFWEQLLEETFNFTQVVCGCQESETDEIRKPIPVAATVV